jgi:hypothetical protein
MPAIPLPISPQAPAASAPAVPHAPAAPAAGAAQARADVRAQVQQTIEDAQSAVKVTRNEREFRITTPDGRTITIPSGAMPTLPELAGGTQAAGPFDHVIPPQVEDIALGFFAMCAIIVVGWPLARAFGRRIERGSSTPAMPAGTAEQLHRIEQAVDTMAIEVERISESQRFMARLQQGSTAERV